MLDAVAPPLTTGYMDISQSGPAVSAVLVTASPTPRLAVAAYLSTVQGPVAGPHRVEPGGLPACRDGELDPHHRQT